MGNFTHIHFFLHSFLSLLARMIHELYSGWLGEVHSQLNRGNFKNMNLKITIIKVEHSSEVLSKIASVLIKKSVLFVDSERFLEGTFLGMTKLAQAERAIKRIIWASGGRIAR